MFRRVINVSKIIRLPTTMFFVGQRSSSFDPTDKPMEANKHGDFKKSEQLSGDAWLGILETKIHTAVQSSITYKNYSQVKTEALAALDALKNPPMKVEKARQQNLIFFAASTAAKVNRVQGNLEESLKCAEIALETMSYLTFEKCLFVSEIAHLAGTICDSRTENNKAEFYFRLSYEKALEANAKNLGLRIEEKDLYARRVALGKALFLQKKYQEAAKFFQLNEQNSSGIATDMQVLNRSFLEKCMIAGFQQPIPKADFTAKNDPMRKDNVEGHGNTSNASKRPWEKQEKASQQAKMTNDEILRKGAVYARAGNLHMTLETYSQLDLSHLSPENLLRHHSMLYTLCAVDLSLWFEALKSAFNAYDTFKTCRPSDSIEEVEQLERIVLAYYHIENFSEALEYALKANEIIKKQNANCFPFASNVQLLFANQISIAGIYSKLNKPAEAEKYWKNAAQLYDELPEFEKNFLQKKQAEVNEKFSLKADEYAKQSQQAQMADLKFKNKIKIKPLDYVVSLCDAAIIGRECGVLSQQVDIDCEEAPKYPVDIVKIKVSKVLFQKRETEPIQVGSEVLVFPAALTKHIDQFKLYYEKRTKKSCIYDAYSPMDLNTPDKIYFISLTCFGWSFVCQTPIEGVNKKDAVIAQLRASFPSYTF